MREASSRLRVTRGVSAWSTAVLSALFIVLGGCGVSLYRPTAANVDKRSAATLEQLERGRKLYIRTCSACHGLHAPEERTPAQWGEVIDTMAARAHIDSAQEDLIYRYLINW